MKAKGKGGRGVSSHMAEDEISICSKWRDALTVESSDEDLFNERHVVILKCKSMKRGRESRCLVSSWKWYMLLQEKDVCILEEEICMSTSEYPS